MFATFLLQLFLSCVTRIVGDSAGAKQSDAPVLHSRARVTRSAHLYQYCKTNVTGR